MRDAQLRTNVQGELDREPTIDATEIGVAARGGIVTLTGLVPSYPEKRTAERAAPRVQGVQAVANDLEVRLPGTTRRTDPEIARAAVDASSREGRVPEGRIQIGVSHGWITLEGEVDRPDQKPAAEEAMHALAGVQRVINRMTMRQPQVPANLKAREGRWSLGSAFPEVPTPSVPIRHSE